MKIKEFTKIEFQVFFSLNIYLTKKKKKMQNPLHVGLDYVRKAVQFDQENKLQEAVENYSKSLEYFAIALKGITNISIFKSH